MHCVLAFIWHSLNDKIIGIGWKERLMKGINWKSSKRDLVVKKQFYILSVDTCIDMHTHTSAGKLVKSEKVPWIVTDIFSWFWLCQDKQIQIQMVRAYSTSAARKEYSMNSTELNLFVSLDLGPWYLDPLSKGSPN